MTAADVRRRTLSVVTLGADTIRLFLHVPAVWGAATGISGLGHERIGAPVASEPFVSARSSPKPRAVLSSRLAYRLRSLAALLFGAILATSA